MWLGVIWIMVWGGICFYLSPKVQFLIHPFACTSFKVEEFCLHWQEGPASVAFRWDLVLRSWLSRDQPDGQVCLCAGADVDLFLRHQRRNRGTALYVSRFGDQSKKRRNVKRQRRFLATKSPFKRWTKRRFTGSVVQTLNDLIGNMVNCQTRARQ